MDGWTKFRSSLCKLLIADCCSNVVNQLVLHMPPDRDDPNHFITFLLLYIHISSWKCLICVEARSSIVLFTFYWTVISGKCKPHIHTERCLVGLGVMLWLTPDQTATMPADRQGAGDAAISPNPGEPPLERCACRPELFRRRSVCRLVCRGCCSPHLGGQRLPLGGCEWCRPGGCSRHERAADRDKFKPWNPPDQEGRVWPLPQIRAVINQEEQLPQTHTHTHNTTNNNFFFPIRH